MPYLIGDDLGVRRRSICNSANVIAFGQTHIALFSPAFSPRVSHNPVCFSAVSTVPNNGNTMVQFVSVAESRVKDTTVVQLPESVGVDSNRDGSNVCSSIFKFRLAFQVSVSGDLSVAESLGGGELAGSVASGVSVAVFEVIDAVLRVDDVLESVVHESTLAAITALFRRSRDFDILDTVNKVLFTHGFQVFSEFGVLAFKRYNSAESPARSTASLVFDGDDQFSAPIHLRRVGQTGHLVVKVGASERTSVSPEPVALLEFLQGHGCELVQFQGEGRVERVVTFNKCVVVSENGETLVGWTVCKHSFSILVFHLPCSPSFFQRKVVKFSCQGKRQKQDEHS